MKRLLLVVVAVLGLLAGALVAGRPEAVPNDIRAIDIPPSSSTLLPTTTMPPPATMSTTTMPPPTTMSTTTTTTPPPTTTAESTSTTLGATISETTQAATTTTEDATTAVGATTTTTILRPATEVVVVVANASDTFGLATHSADRIREFGYISVIRTDGVQELANTVIYFAAGFEGDARRLAGQLSAPSSLVEPLPEGPLYEGNAQADVVVLLGNDWREVTNLG